MRECKKYIKVERDCDGFSKKQKQSFINQQKVNRPPKDVLQKFITEKSFCEIGRMYGVSDNAVRNWCKKYNLPFRKKDINSIVE